MRRNLILFLAMCSLVFLWSALGFAQGCVQDTGDHGQMDQTFIDCTPPDQFAKDSAVVSFDWVFTTDATPATNLVIGGYNAAFLITASCSARVYVDTLSPADGPVWAGTAAGTPNSWEARFNSSVPVSGILPAVVVYGAIQDLFPPPNAGPSLASGTHILAHIVVIVYDTCCVTIDTTHTQTISLNVVRQDAVGYAPCWQGPYQCCIAPCTPEAAPICNAPPAAAGLAGQVISFPVTASDADVNCCYTFVSCSFDILENPPSEAGASLVGTCGANVANLTFSWPTGNADPEGDYHVVFTFVTDCDEVVVCTTKVTLAAKCLFATIGEGFGRPGGKATVPITIEATGTSIGGFTFCIEYDPVSLTFVSLERGDFFNVPHPTGPQGSYLWNYLVWRNEPSTVIHKFKLCVVGIGNLYYYGGTCMQQGQSGQLLLTFRLANNELYRCFRTPVVWERLDPQCLVNAFSDCSGSKVNVPDNPAFFDPQLCPGLYPKAQVVACARLVDGGITFNCVADPAVRGDINCNGFAYEIGDAVCFANYFVGGGLCPVPVECLERQINATDINADGLTLSIADLVYLLRILSGDQAPLGGPKVAPFANSVDVNWNGKTIKIDNQVDLGAAWFVFKGEATKVEPIISGVKVEYGISNGETRVLVYGMKKGEKISAGNSELFRIYGVQELKTVEAAEYYSAAVNVNIHSSTVPMPTAFALSQNYPNPFNDSTTIRFALPVSSNVSLKIYNVAGQLVKEFSEEMTAGYKSITWDGTNMNGDVVASGVYFYKLQAADFAKTLKMTLLK